MKTQHTCTVTPPPLFSWQNNSQTLVSAHNKYVTRSLLTLLSITRVKVGSVSKYRHRMDVYLNLLCRLMNIYSGFFFNRVGINKSVGSLGFPCFLIIFHYLGSWASWPLFSLSLALIIMYIWLNKVPLSFNLSSLYIKNVKAYSL